MFSLKYNMFLYRMIQFSIRKVSIIILLKNKFNKFSSRRNLCGCEHGGECLERSRTCFCSHGFTGDRCQKRVRKALLVGGVRGVETRTDTELVGGLEVRRCKPPDYPLPVVAPTGQTLGQDVVVCGGAYHDGELGPREILRFCD